MNIMHLLEAMTNIDASIIEKAPAQTKLKGNSVTRILLIAALIAALTMTVLASGGIINWFHSYFQKLSGQALNEEQITFIEENTTEIAQSQTCNGYTLTVESAITDGNNGYIKLKLTAPEDVVLDATGYFPGNDGYLTALEPGEMNSWNMGWGIVEDDDGKENTVSMICILRDLLEDRTQWKLHVEDIHGTYYENPGTANYRLWTETIAEGIWDFDVTLTQTGNEELELIAEPITGEVNIALDKADYRQVTITSMKLRAMSAEITYEFLEPTHAEGDFDAIYVVMKDGSKTAMRPTGGYQGYCTYRFMAPIILEDADYVLLPDGTKLPIP